VSIYNFAKFHPTVSHTNWNVNYWVGACWSGHEAIIGLDSFKMIFLGYRHGNNWVGAWWSGHEAIIGLD
jgi:hypothetical protein